MSQRSNSLPEIGKPKSSNKPQIIFIHKLYDMLLDSNLNHLIWWSKSGDSFFIIPNEEFSKVLSFFFKHTNIASFIRQLNMYGFHKVNDLKDDKKDDKEIDRDDRDNGDNNVNIDKSKDYETNHFRFDKSNESSPLKNVDRIVNDEIKEEIETDDQEPEKEKDLKDKDEKDKIVKWEFKHSNGQFKRGDIESLKLIKRRSSKNITKEILISNNNYSPQSNLSLNQPTNNLAPTTPSSQSNSRSTSNAGLNFQNLSNGPPPLPTNSSNASSQIDDISSYHQNLVNNQINLQNSISIDKYLELLNNFNNLKYELSNLLNKFDYFLNDYKFSQKNLIKLIEILQSNNLNDLNNFKNSLISNLNESIIVNEGFLKGGVNYYPLNPYYSLRASHGNKSVSIGPEQNPQGPSTQSIPQPGSHLQHPPNVQSGPNGQNGANPPSQLQSSPQSVNNPSNQHLPHIGPPHMPPHQIPPHHQIPIQNYQPFPLNSPNSPHHQSPHFTPVSPFPTSAPFLNPHHPPQQLNRASRSYSPMSRDYFPVMDPPTPRNSIDQRRESTPQHQTQAQTTQFAQPPSNLTPQSSSNTVPGTKDTQTQSIHSNANTTNTTTLNPPANITTTPSQTNLNSNFGLGIMEDKERLPSVSELDKSIQNSKEKRKMSDDGNEVKKLKF
ncbi:hypothetical protein CLIB1444_20S00298 [[Candida] jaroonii]|uniref:Uncharacterized protein n=1 Tax=[Candida] jaroonii TaxID=467808 RepID=A0ACA9YF96_9ASCO|nr:hypothetical protein CLIB1444_20S00298 [[Candida] jaroonii]